MRVGELRALVDSSPELTWNIADHLQDDDEVPQYPIGAVPPDDSHLAQALPRVNFPEILPSLGTGHELLLKRRGRIADVLAAAAPTAAAPAPVAGLSTSVDWRNRWGWPWITTVRDQNPCGACVDFGTTALVEAMTRIEHCVWTTRSEGDLHDGAGRKCADGWWPDGALTWVKNNGLADPGCYPWDTADNPYNPTPDRPGRTVKIDSWQEIGSVADQKAWIDTIGPLVGCFEVWTDFGAVGTGIYRKAPTATFRGWHCVLFIGYDDAAGAWLCKNSWGTTFGDRGFFRIAYGEVNVDKYGKFGLRGTNPDPVTKRRQHNGNFFESGNGAGHRNFELLATAGGGALRHWYREGTGAMVWKEVSKFSTDAASSATFTNTTFGRNMEGIYLTTGRRLRHCFNGPAAGGAWQVTAPFGPADAAGVPGFLQSDVYGAPGNFEVVVRTAGGQLAHWWRINGAPWTWRESARFGSAIAHSGATLVQARNRNLELVAVNNDGTMQRYVRDDVGGTMAWRAAERFGEGISSPPVMIEASFGAVDERSQGNYELCVARGGRVEHWWRANRGDQVWRRSATFGSDVRAVVGLVQGSFGFNLEVVVVRTDNQLQHYWRDGSGWRPGVVIGPAA